ncbi:Smr domain protein [Sulfitobacter noctilucicola]|uniref:DNA-nicking Smr family endonuclease n=1 Tax=Sulfitobacter noctilucicola TaxID=1342301 RepID=A0A7W6M5P7_9RHOB|nr:Smr/MutS family protein [Sulfitobacter noctilucicola]KIN62837.1 Smr domain protein [Sulfitobacter noctilucicola]MBB4172632.1 DNA-nicking Smr family endonuclease [Sulfitobacter noctilucicola]
MKQRRKHGQLNDDDLELWRKVTERTEKLDLKSLFTPEIDASPPSVPNIRKAKTVLMGKSDPPARRSTHHLAPSLPDQINSAPVQMDQKAFGKLKRGKLRPEGRIDLHGMTLDRAHPALTRFILSSHKSGKRLVLVITGKGKQRDEGGPIPVRFGVLRHQVPQWLAMPPLSAAVLQVSQAHISHGGGGAYYVYLRRVR